MLASVIHRWLAWTLAVPLLWLSLTGALLGFSNEMDRIMNVELMTTPMSQQPSLPEAAQIGLLNQSYPDYQLVSFTLAQNPVDTSMAVMKDRHGEWWQVFINPKLGVINGIRPLASDWTVSLTRWHNFAFLSSAWGGWLAMMTSLLAILVLFSGWLQSRNQQQTRYSLHRLLGQWATPLLLLLMISGILVFAQSQHLLTAGVDWVSVHQGDWLGIPGRLLWVLLSLLLAWLIIGGLWLVSTHKKDY